jgi:hypothetical protein
MARRVTLTFADGSQHVYDGVPDDATPREVQERADREFAGRKLVHIDGGRAAAIPGQEGEAARVAVAQAQPQPTLAQRAVGTGEAALNVATGAVGGTAGMAYGAVKGIAEGILSGNIGTREVANLVEQSAAQGAQALTYAPRTEQGQEQAATVGRVMQQMLPVAPLTGEMATLARGATAARQTAAPLVASTIDSTLARGAAPATQQPAAAAAAPVAQAAAPAAAQSLTALTQTARRAAVAESPKAQATLAQAAAPDPKVVAAADRLGIREYLQPDHVTTNQAFRELAQAVKSIPGSEARTAEIAGLTKVAERASKIVDDIGGADVSAISEGVKRAQLGRIDDLAAMEKTLYGKVKAGLPPTTPAPAEGALAFLRRRADELGGAENLSAMEREIMRRLTPGEDGRQPTYALLDDVRRDVGAVTARGGPFADADVGLAKKYYGLLSDDQLRVADASGQRWNYLAAQYASRMRKGVEDDMVALFGREIDKSLASPLSTATAALAKGDADKLGRILAAVPASMRTEVTAAGLLTAFRTAETRGPVSFVRYEKWYEGLLKNKQAYSAVMSNLPAESRKQLSDLYRVSKAVNAASRERITTGRIQAAREQFSDPDTLAGRLYDAARRGAVGATVGTAVGSVLGPGVGGAIASALTKGAKPEAIRAVDKLLVSPELEQQRAAIKALAKAPEMVRLMRHIGVPSATAAQREAWIAQTLAPAAQVPAMQSRSDDRPMLLPAPAATY